MNMFMNRLAWASVISMASLTTASAHMTPETGNATAGSVHNANYTVTDGKPAGESVKVGDLDISGAFARATLPGAPVGGGFITITNNGESDDRLVGGSSDVAGVLQIHNMRMDGDVMKMYQMPDGILIPPHETVTLQPGGMHIMFMDLKGALVEDTVINVELTFEKAGTVTVPFPVRSIAAQKGDQPMNHGAMKSH